MTEILGFGHLNFGNWNFNAMPSALCAMRFLMSDAKH
jgi:hypothetical protein